MKKVSELSAQAQDGSLVIVSEVWYHRASWHADLPWQPGSPNVLIWWHSHAAILDLNLLIHLLRHHSLSPHDYGKKAKPISRHLWSDKEISSGKIIYIHKNIWQYKLFVICSTFLHINHIRQLFVFIFQPKWSNSEYTNNFLLRKIYYE